MRYGLKSSTMKLYDSALTSAFLQWISRIAYKQQLWAVSLIQPVSCVNLQACGRLYEGTPEMGTSLSILTYTEQEWAASGACAVWYMYLGGFLLLPQAGQSSPSECWSQGPAQEAAETMGSCVKAECHPLSLTTTKALTQTCAMPWY